MTLVQKGAVIRGSRGSSLAFWVQIFREKIQVFFVIFSGMVVSVQMIPVQFCNDFVGIKVGFLPWKPPEMVNKNKINNHKTQLIFCTNLEGHIRI